MSPVQSYAGLMGRQLPMFNPFMQGLRLWGGGGVGQPLGGGQVQQPKYNTPYLNNVFGPQTMPSPEPKANNPYMNNLFGGQGMQQMSQAPSAGPMMGDTRYAPGYNAQNTPPGPVDYRQFAQAPMGAGKAMADMASPMAPQMGQPTGQPQQFTQNQGGMMTGISGGSPYGGYAQLAQGPTAPMGGWGAVGQPVPNSSGVGNQFGGMPGPMNGAAGPEPYNQSASFPQQGMPYPPSGGGQPGQQGYTNDIYRQPYQQVMDQNRQRGQQYTIYG